VTEYVVLSNVYALNKMLTCSPAVFCGEW